MADKEAAMKSVLDVSAGEAKPAWMNRWEMDRRFDRAPNQTNATVFEKVSGLESALRQRMDGS